MSPYDRRALLMSTGLAAAAVGLGACGSDSPSGEPPASTGSNGSTGAASGTAVPLADVPVGGGVVLPDADYVVTQPTEGEVKAFTKICTHQQCPVARIDEGNIVCDCHGSRFSITDGSVTQGPAKNPLETFPAEIDGDSIRIG